MPVNKQDSLVADSTLSSSPITTPVVKRAARTYGRPRQQALREDELEPLGLSSFASSVSRKNTYRTAPPDVNEEIPPTSDPLHPSVGEDVSDAEEYSEHASSPFQFSWKKDLREIDKDDDDDIIAMPRKEWGERFSNICSGQTKTPEGPRSGARCHAEARPAFADDVFGKPSALLPSSSRSPKSPESRPESPRPSAASLSFHNQHASETLHDSDSPNECFEDKPSPIDTSPSFVINSPKSRHTPTPPTSDDDMSLQPSSKPLKHGNKKGQKLRRNVIPLQFNEKDMDGHSSVSRRKGKPKVMAPTKKDLLEIERQRGRLAEAQLVTVPREAGRAEKYSIQSFLSLLSSQRAEPSSDPIGSFSSPERNLSQTNEQRNALAKSLVEESSSSQGPEKPQASVNNQRLVFNEDDSENDFPEVQDLTAKGKEKEEGYASNLTLAERKQRLLAFQSTRSTSRNDDDDDIEIEVLPPKEKGLLLAGKEARKLHISEARKRQLNLSGIIANRAKAADTPAGVSDMLMVNRIKTGDRKGGGIKDQSQLVRILAHEVSKKNAEEIKRKEEEWVRRGGRVLTATQPGDSVDDAWREVAKQGLEALDNRDVGKVAAKEDETHESDGDWDPEANESITSSSGGKESSPEADEELSEQLPKGQEMGADSENDADEEQIIKSRQRRHQRVLDSDSEGEEQRDTKAQLERFTFGSPRTSRLPALSVDSEDSVSDAIPKASMGRRDSSCSTHLLTDDENDKENITSLMYDRSEDKENKAVVRHMPMSEMSLFSPTQSAQGRKLRSREGSLNGSMRLPSFELRLEQADKSDSSLPTASLQLEPLIESQSNIVDDAVQCAEKLQLAYSDLFESTTQQEGLQRSSSRAEFISLSNEELSLGKLRKDDSLELTQDLALQPAFELGGSLLKKADQIFEKEQEYLLEIVNKKQQKESELYINDHGFLTQTRPDVLSPEVYRPIPPSQNTAVPSQRASQLSRRTPLRTLSFSGELETSFSGIEPLRRLRRGTSPPPSTTRRSSPSPSPNTKSRPLNAFKLMNEAARKRLQQPSRPLEKSEFIEAEAEESDDDETFGFGPRRKDDGEEEDGEDLDRTLETLVDDRDMDEKTLAAERVLEKFKEQEEKDDEEIEKLHQAAVAGELRKKKRNHGVGFDDSGTDSEDDEMNRRIRHSMHKRLKIDRDNIRELGEHEETKSFYQAYEHGLIDNDDADFAYLQESQDATMVEQEETVEPQEYITPQEIQQRVREMAEQNEVAETLNPHDVSWIEGGSDDEAGIRVKAVNRMGKQPSNLRGGVNNHMDIEPGFESRNVQVLDEANRSRMQSWAKAESRSRNMGTARSVGGVAVTGHKVKNGRGTVRNGPSQQSSSKASSNLSRKPREAASLLKLVDSGRDFV